MKVLSARFALTLLLAATTLWAPAQNAKSAKKATPTATATKDAAASASKDAAANNTQDAAATAPTPQNGAATDSAKIDTAGSTQAAAATQNDSAATADIDMATAMDADETPGFHQALKTKFIEGNAGFMSLVALALILGLAFCVERMIYLSLSEINAKRFMDDLEKHIDEGDLEGAREMCNTTRGPVAALCREGLQRMGQGIESVERTVVSYGAVQSANLEKGCSWITLFIAAAPSLGFLGTVIGMVIAFDQIQQAGDISPTIVASGMKVALITTIFGIIAALILQVFYNYVLSKIEHLTAQMEESAIRLLDAIMRYEARHE